MRVGIDFVLTPLSRWGGSASCVPVSFFFERFPPADVKILAPLRYSALVSLGHTRVFFFLRLFQDLRPRSFVPLIYRSHVWVPLRTLFFFLGEFERVFSPSPGPPAPFFDQPCVNVLGLLNFPSETPRFLAICSNLRPPVPFPLV